MDTTSNYTFKNKNLEKLAENNPHRQMQYTPGGWDYFINGVNSLLGTHFKSAEDRFKDQTANDAALYDSQLRELDTQQEYDSAEQQAQRLREAGQNPDLTGGVSPGEAGQVDNQATQSREIEDQGQKFGEVIQNSISIVSTLLSSTTTALAAVKDIQGIIRGSDEMYNTIEKWVQDRISNVGTVNEYGEYSDPYFTGPSHQVVELGDNGEFELNPAIKVSTTTFREFDRNPLVRERFRTRTQRRYAYRAYENAMRDMRTMTGRINAEKDLFAATKGKEENQVELGKIRATPGYDAEEGIVKGVENAYREVYKTAMDVVKASNKYQKDYYTTLNGITQAKAENDRAEYSSQVTNREMGEKEKNVMSKRLDTALTEEEYKNQIKKAMSGLMNKLAKMAENAGPMEAYFLGQLMQTMKNIMDNDGLGQLGQRAADHFGNAETNIKQAAMMAL